MTSLPGSSKTVLVADDTAFVRERFCHALEHAGHRALTAKTASELLSQVRAELDHLALIILDLHLPDGGGLALVRAVRKIDDGRLPILIFSGTLAGTAEVRHLAELGVVGYINEYSAPKHILAALAPHLFPDSFNRRTGSRVLLGIPVSYRLRQLIASGVTLNVGRGGIAIRTIDPLAMGTIVRLRFRLPGTGGDIEADGRVVWSDRRLGMGLQFETVAPSHQNALDQFVERHFFTNRRA